jgi:DNA-binding MarR family transcriptional regulator
MGIIEQLRWAFDKEGLSTTEKFVLVALSYRANKKGECWPSLADIATMCGINRATASRAIMSLARQGIIVRRRRFSRSTMYSLQLSHSAVIAQCDKRTEQHQLLNSATIDIALRDAEGPLKDHKNRPKKKRERFSPDLSKLECSEQRRAALAQWLDYKNQKGQFYVEMGWNALMAKIAPFTDQQVSEAITTAIIEQWKGFFPKSVNERPTNGFHSHTPRPTFTENAHMPPEAFVETDFMAEMRATLAMRDEELNGRREVAR